MNRVEIVLLFGMFFIAFGSVNAAAVNLYQRVEETMTNSTSFTNPFTETELRLTVTAPSGRPLGSSFTWYGFYDGDGGGGQTGNVWKFRLLFDYAGTWNVSAGFYVPGTSTSNGQSQNFSYNVSSSKFTQPSGYVEKGHVYKDSGNWRRLKFADGTPWVPFVMHSSMLIDRDVTMANNWIDQHSSRGVDALAVRFHAEVNSALGGTSYWHYLKTDGTRAVTYPGETGFDYTKFDLASWRHNENIINYAQSKGIKLSVWYGISGLTYRYWSYGPKDYPNNTTLGPNQKLTIRYFLARWAPYTCWWHWTVDAEFDIPPPKGPGIETQLPRNLAYAAELKAKNPWKTLVTTHVLRDWTAGSSTDWGIATLQKRVVDSDSGATDCRTFITDNAIYNMPVYNSEGVWQLNVTRTRVATWTHIMAGGFSKAAWDALDDDHNYSSWGANWDLIVADHKNSAIELGKISNFFNKTPGIDISKGVPNNGLASVSGGNLALCLAQPGLRYYIWADRGGTVSVNLTGQTGTYTVKRYRCTDLANPATLSDISGGDVRNLGATPTSGFGNDYLFVIKNSSITNEPPIVSINADKTYAYPSENVTFTATASDSDGSIVSHIWRWGNTNESLSGVPAASRLHNWSATGQYPVYLTVTDNGSPALNGDSNPITVNVVNNKPPTITSAVAIPNLGSAPLTVNFSATAIDPDGNPLTYQWDFTGDGAYDATGQNVLHTYNNVGHYTPVLRVTDGANPVTRGLTIDVDSTAITVISPNGGES